MPQDFGGDLWEKITAEIIAKRVWTKTWSSITEKESFSSPNFVTVDINDACSRFCPHQRPMRSSFIPRNKVIPSSDFATSFLSYWKAQLCSVLIVGVTHERKARRFENVLNERWPLRASKSPLLDPMPRSFASKERRERWTYFEAFFLSFPPRRLWYGVNRTSFNFQLASWLTLFWRGFVYYSPSLWGGLTFEVSICYLFHSPSTLRPPREKGGTTGFPISRRQKCRQILLKSFYPSQSKYQRYHHHWFLPDYS